MPDFLGLTTYPATSVASSLPAPVPTCAHRVPVGLGSECSHDAHGATTFHVGWVDEDEDDEDAFFEDDDDEDDDDVDLDDDEDLFDDEEDEDDDEDDVEEDEFDEDDEDDDDLFDDEDEDEDEDVEEELCAPANAVAQSLASSTVNADGAG